MNGGARRTPTAFRRKRHGDRFQPHDLIGARQQGLGEIPGRDVEPSGPEALGAVSDGHSPRTGPISITWIPTAKSRRSITPFWSATPSSMKFSVGSGIASLSYWADPARKQQGEINRHDGGRGVYFEDPNGHLLEAHHPLRTAAADGIHETGRLASAWRAHDPFINMNGCSRTSRRFNVAPRNEQRCQRLPLHMFVTGVKR